MKTAKDIQQLGISPRHVWRYVRYAGIEPHKGSNGRLCITEAEYNAFTVALSSGMVKVKLNKPKREPQPDDHMRERVSLPPEAPKPIKRRGYTYIPAPGAPKAWNWAQSVGK